VNLAEIAPLETAVWIGLCCIFIFLSGFYSGTETGLYCANRMRLRLRAHRGQKSARRLQSLLNDRSGLLFTTLVGTNAANYLAPVCLTAIFLGSIELDASLATREGLQHRAELLTTLILTPIVFIFGEIVPKNIFQRHADRYMLRAAGLLSFTHQIVRFSGLIRLERTISEFVIRRFQRQPIGVSALHSRLQMYEMLREGATDSGLTRTQLFILERIPTLKALRLASVMTPRLRAIMISENASPPEIEKIVRQSRYSRMPVYRSTRTNVVGTIHIIDLLTQPPDETLKSHIAPPVSLPHTMTVIRALESLQSQRRRMAIVVDNNDKCLGLVTVKDLVEEIIGELDAW
jgi:putative hemolysin